MGMINQIKRLDAKKSGLHVVDDNELTKLKATLLDMLKDLIDVFDTNDIQWSLSGGSIIGAVRHHGGLCAGLSGPVLGHPQRLQHPDEREGRRRAGGLQRHDAGRGERL